jgi:CRISPR-associated endonuclease/helicase Cas3
MATMKYEQRVPSVLNFWGKARSTDQAACSYHPIVYHSLDVAAVGADLIARDRKRLTRIAAAAGVQVDALRGALPFLLTLHDIGKYARVFQAKSPDHWPADVLGPYRVIAPGNSHVVAGFQMLDELFDNGAPREIFEMVLPDWRAGERKILFRALAGHHGRPPKEGERSSLGAHDVCAACVSAAEAHIKAMFALLRPSALPRRSTSQLTILAVGLAGLFVLADWIGSAETWFPYVGPIEGDPTFEHYWSRARNAAKEAVDEARITPPMVARFAGMLHLFPGIRSPSPVQAFAETAPLPDGPSLIIVEDVTGSGKTEAALTLAHRLMAEGRANGLYVALPTEATANAMYMRLGYSFRELFTTDATPSLVLAHGRRALHHGFQDSIVSAAARGDARNGTRADDGDEHPSSAECADWIADDRRKAFLADVGAGTIDQALLAILPVKHQSLRLWGLADRVLIVDEAHAYDAYMTRELETLLEFHAALGGSAVILSATLPKAARNRFADAFRKGVSAGCVAVVELRATNYPLLTIIGPDSAIEAPQPIRHGLARFVTSTRVDDLDAALARVITAAEAGACVAFVRNSVDEAIAACDRLRAAGLDPLLFHARFAMCDRQRIEAEVMGLFGPPPTDAATRRGRVLVATQVIEQSLDLDFDLMVTDLAPIDLMIQRAGRLCRHERGPRPIAGPELVVLSADPIADPDKDWANRVLGRGARVYPNHALLWRSARTLFGARGIHTPEGVRALVEAVYGDNIELAPKKLDDSEIRHDGKMKADTTVADMNVLYLHEDMSHPFPGYQEGRGKWDPDIHTPTRLTEDSMRIRLGRLVDGMVRPWAEAEEPWRAWALSEVSVRRGRVDKEDDSDPLIATAVTAAKAQWPEAERTVPLIALRRQDETWVGFGRDRDGKTARMLYSTKSGLSFF